jgi:uncharacterized phage-associated protein
MGDIIYIYDNGGGDSMTRKKAGAASINDVANYFLSRVDVQTGSVMTHLKLQKLCYYAQAWNLAFDGEPLFKGKFQAWAHGPVCPSLWKKYSGYSYHEIPASESFDNSKFTKDQLETLDAVWENYGQYDGRYLEELTHQELPWINARNGLADGEQCTRIIDENEMKQYYTSLLEEHGQKQ